jgi:hypothetical protein
MTVPRKRRFPRKAIQPVPARYEQWSLTVDKSGTYIIPHKRTGNIATATTLRIEPATTWLMT